MNKLTNPSKILFCILYSIFIVGCSDDSSSTKSNQEKVIRPAKTAIVEHGSSNGIRHFPATVKPSKFAEMAFRLNGEIADVLVVAGQKVQRGDVLVRLDDKDLLVQVEQAEAKFKLARSQKERADKLLKDGLVSSSEADQIEAEFDISKAQLQIARNNLEYSKLIAPFDGAIAELHVEPFEFVQAKQPILELHSRESIDVTIEVPEQLMIRLPKSGEAGSYKPALVFDVNPNVKYRVNLKEFDISPNRATKSYQVVFTLVTPSDINVLPGMTGTLEVELDKLMMAESANLKVPAAALFIPNGMTQTDIASNRSFLYRLNEQLVTELIAVEIIELHQDGAVIKPIEETQLKVGDEIIAAGPHLLDNGTKVLRWKQERGL